MPKTKYIVQNVLTGVFLDFDLPITTTGPVFELTAAGSLSGTIAPEMRYIVPLEEWQTAIYQETDGEIRWGGLIQGLSSEGAELRIEAAGFSSYPNGLSYTGSLYSHTDWDPTQAFYDLWNHVQSQVDGDLGVDVIMPTPPCTTRIGTTEEPYVLAPEEVPDIGDELNRLATETPFDYIERHYWSNGEVVTESAPSSTAVSWMAGYGNLEGGYTGTDAGNWKTTRAADQTDFIDSLGVDIFGATELHEETSSAMPKGADKFFIDLMKSRHPNSKWELFRGKGGNQLLYKTTVFKVLKVANRSGVDDSTRSGTDNFRSVSVFTVQHIASGFIFEFRLVHFHANDNDGSDRSATREAEAKDVIAQIKARKAGSPPVLLVGDVNEYNTGTHDPPGIFAAEGYLKMQVRMSGMPNTGVDSGTGTGGSGHWIEGYYTRTADWDVSEGAGVLTSGLSDHHLWMKLRITARSTVGATVAQREVMPRTISHEIVIGWPRLGRRRRDLTFIQGDNVISLVPINRHGDEFANTMIGLGKGEGATMVRTEIANRDGRLRRTGVFTDKTADTTGRLSGQLKKEFAARQLLPQIDSITVRHHPNAPLGSWQLGDDILVQGTIPWEGKVSIWCRVVGWTMQGEDVAILTLARSEIEAGVVT